MGAVAVAKRIHQIVLYHLFFSTVKANDLYMVLVLTKTDPTASNAGDPDNVACTGTLVRSDVVLTLASCVVLDKSQDVDPKSITVIERTIGTGGNHLQVIHVDVNPNYFAEDEYLSMSHDFCVITVQHSNQTVFPQLPKDNLVILKHAGDKCIIGGYGIGGDVSINHFKSYMFNITELDEYKGKVCQSDAIMCLHFDDIMPCYDGDFGGPLICSNVLYSLNTPRTHYSAGMPKCEGWYITVFSSVFNVLDWLDQRLESHWSALDWLNNPFVVLFLCCGVFAIMVVIYYGLVELIQWRYDPGDQAHQTIRLNDVDLRDSWLNTVFV